MDPDLARLIGFGAIDQDLCRPALAGDLEKSRCIRRMRRRDPADRFRRDKSHPIRHLPRCGFRARQDHGKQSRNMPGGPAGRELSTAHDQPIGVTIPARRVMARFLMPSVRCLPTFSAPPREPHSGRPPPFGEEGGCEAFHGKTSTWRTSSPSTSRGGGPPEVLYRNTTVQVPGSLRVTFICPRACPRGLRGGPQPLHTTLDPVVHEYAGVKVEELADALGRSIEDTEALLRASESAGISDMSEIPADPYPSAGRDRRSSAIP